MTNEQHIENLKKLKSFHNGSYGADIDRAIKALEQEPCKDAVSRQEILDYLDKMPSELTSDGRRMVRRRTLEEYISDTLPPVAPQQKIGRWIEEIDDYGKVMRWHCDKCYEDSGFTTNCKWDFCPNCGAKMVEPQESEDKE